MANTTVRDSGNNIVTFRSYDTGAGLLAGVVLSDPTGNTSYVIPVILPADQDPVFDHTSAVRLSLTASTSTALITPPAGCKYVRVSCDADAYINTANGAAGDTATCIKINANAPEVIPVVASVRVNIFSANSAIARATPMKAR